MPTKTPSKKTRKPTQPKRFTSVEQVIRTYFPKKYAKDMEDLKLSVGRIESRLAVLNSFETFMRTMEESKSPAPAPKEPEPHTFKKGDWVVVTGRCGLDGEFRFVGVVGTIERWHTTLSDEAWVVAGTDSWFRPCNIRPATAEEIAAHWEAKKKQEEENEKRRAARIALDEAKARLVDLQMYTYAKIIRDMQREQFPD